jgi:hypothetical protein
MRDIPLHQGRKRDSPLSKYAIKHFEGIDLPARIFDSDRFPDFHWNGEKTITNLGIISNPRPPSNFLMRLVKRKGRSVRAIRGHGIHRVRNSKNPGSDRNFHAFEPARVSCAVASFMVRQNDFGGLSEKGDLFNKVIPDLNVATHDDPLFLR